MNHTLIWIIAIVVIAFIATYLSKGFNKRTHKASTSHNSPVAVSSKDDKEHTPTRVINNDGTWDNTVPVGDHFRSGNRTTGSRSTETTKTSGKDPIMTMLENSKGGYSPGDSKPITKDGPSSNTTA